MTLGGTAHKWEVASSEIDLEDKALDLKVVITSSGLEITTSRAVAALMVMGCSQPYFCLFSEISVLYNVAGLVQTARPGFKLTQS